MNNRIVLNNSLVPYVLHQLRQDEEAELEAEELSLSVPKQEKTPPYELRILRECLEKLISEKTNLNHTLEDYILKACSRTFVKQKEDSLEYLHAFTDVQCTILKTKKCTTQEFNKNMDRLFGNSPKKEKVSTLKLIAQVGQKFLNRPLYEILGKKSTESFSEEYLREMHKAYDHLHVLAKIAHIAIKRKIKELNKVSKLLNDYSTLQKIAEIKDDTDIRNQVFESRYEHFLKKRVMTIEKLKTTIGKTNKKLHNSCYVINDFMFLKSKGLFNICFEDVKRLYLFSNELVEYRKLLDLSIYEKGKKILECSKFDKALKKDNSVLTKAKINVERYEKSVREPQVVKDPLIALEKEKKSFITWCNLYELINGKKSDGEIYDALTELIFGDELNFKAQRNKNNTNDKVKKQEPIQSNTKNLSPKSKAKKLNIKDALPEAHFNEKSLEPYEEILVEHAEWIYEFSNKLKEHLKSNLPENASVKDLERPKIHAKGLFDQIQYLSRNFELFCKAIIHKDLYALGGIIPFLFLDQHLAIEQLIKHQITLKGEKPTSHNLVELNESCEQSSNPVIEELSDALLEARYSILRSRKNQNEPLSNSLNWTLYSQKLCKVLNSEEEHKDNEVASTDLIELCGFIFESHRKTIQCLVELCGLDEEVDSLFDLEKILEILKKSIEPQSISEKILEIKKSRANERDNNVILKSREIIKENGQKSLRHLDHKDFPESILQEALSHLTRIDAVNYVQQKYPDIQYAALHHRNLLMFQWVYELLYRFHGHASGIGELRWICNHDLEAFHKYIFSEESMPEGLSEFNLGRNLHYTHELGAAHSLKMIEELLETLKNLKRCDPGNPEFILKKKEEKKKGYATLPKSKTEMDEDRLRIFEKGIETLQKIIKLLFGDMT